MQISPDLMYHQVMEEELVLELTPEQVSRAFLCLAGQLPFKVLEPELQGLSDKSWVALAEALLVLEKEKELSVLQ
jgi:hypothetical protein